MYQITFLRSGLRYSGWSYLAAVFLFTLLTLLCGSDLAAQNSEQADGDARVLDRGSIEIGLKGDWLSAYQRYTTSGSNRLGLGQRFSLDTLGSSALPILTPVEDKLRSLTGNTDFRVTLGASQVRLNQSVTRVPFDLRVGVSKRVTVGVTVPLVQTLSEVAFTTPTDAGGANLAFNPAISDDAKFNSDTAFINQMRRAAQAVISYCNAAGTGTAICNSASTLGTEADAFALDLQDIYATGLFIPIAGSAGQLAIDNRSAQYVAGLNAFAGVAGSGVTAISAPSVSGAPVALGTQQLQFLLESPILALRADSLHSISRWNLGDIELNARVLLFSNENIGASISSPMPPQPVRTTISAGVMLRLPTGHIPSADNYIDLPSGTKALGVGGRLYTDVAVGKRMRTSLVARYDVNFASNIETRVGDSTTSAYLQGFRKMEVERKLGNLFEFEMTPRFVFNNYVSLALNYSFHSKSQDSYSGAAVTVDAGDSTGGVAVLIDPSRLGQETGYTDHRLGGGISFTNRTAIHRGSDSPRIRIPFEVSYFRTQSVSGAGSTLARTTQNWMGIRLFFDLFGRGVASR